MALQSQSVLYRRLTDTYFQAVAAGKDSVPVHIGWLEDILDYLDPEDTQTNKIHKTHLDDQRADVILMYINMKEKDNGPIFGKPE